MIDTFNRKINRQHDKLKMPTKKFYIICSQILKDSNKKSFLP